MKLKFTFNVGNMTDVKPIIIEDHLICNGKIVQEDVVSGATVHLNEKRNVDACMNHLNDVKDRVLLYLKEIHNVNEYFASSSFEVTLIQ